MRYIEMGSDGLSEVLVAARAQRKKQFGTTARRHGVVSVVRMCSVHDESDEDSRDEIKINGQMIITDLARALVLLCLPATECTEPCLGPSSSDLVTPVAMPARPSLYLQSIHCTCLLCPPARIGSPLIRNRLGLLPHRPIWRSACPPPPSPLPDTLGARERPDHIDSLDR